MINKTLLTATGQAKSRAEYTWELDFHLNARAPWRRMIQTLTVNPIQVLAVSGLAVALGIKLNRKISFLRDLNIPAAIVGGLVFATAALVLHNRLMNFEVDTTLRNVLMIAAFTTVGLNANLLAVRRGGIQVGFMMGLAIFGAVLQAILGVGLAMAFGLHPLIGIVAGPMAFAGGPSNALAFGPMFEGLGITGATTTAVASATFGIVVAGLVAGWTGGALIRRSAPPFVPRHGTTDMDIKVPPGIFQPPGKRATLLTHVLLISFCYGCRKSA